jgi:hypothetical protein
VSTKATEDDELNSSFPFQSTLPPFCVSPSMASPLGQLRPLSPEITGDLVYPKPSPSAAAHTLKAVHFLINTRKFVVQNSLGKFLQRKVIGQF